LGYDNKIDESNDPQEQGWWSGGGCDKPTAVDCRRRFQSFKNAMPPDFLDSTTQMISFSCLFFKKDDKSSVAVSILIRSIRHGQSVMPEATAAAPPKNKELVDKLSPCHP
jgi:hypothetical protein